jgi:hypothetical protein
MNSAAFRLSAARGLVLLGATLSLVAGPWSRAAIPVAVPELFAGEVEDVGPQFLLLVAAPSAAPLRLNPTVENAVAASAPMAASARPQPLELWSELEITRTSNATLVETNPTSSTITSAQAGGTWHFAGRPRWGGQLAFETGFRLQTYRYGLLADPNRKINFLEIDRNNFDLVGAHVGAMWRRDGWLAMTSLRGASLKNRGNDRVFYQEGAFEWQAYRFWRLGARGSLAAGAEGALRWSHTDSFGLLAPGWNNRIEQGLVAFVDQGLGAGAKWRVQPALRIQGSHYTYRDRHRDDVHASGRLSLARLIGRGELRLGIGYDRRNSSEAAIADFSKWDLNLAGRMQWRF